MCLGIPGKIIEIIDAKQMLAKVDIAGIRRPVNIECIMTTEYTAKDCIGDWVLVHVGFAMSRIDKDEAQKTLDLLSELSEMQEEMDTIHASQQHTEKQNDR